MQLFALAKAANDRDLSAVNAQRRPTHTNSRSIVQEWAFRSALCGPSPLSALQAPRVGRWPGVRSPAHARGPPVVVHGAQRHQRRPSSRRTPGHREWGLRPYPRNHLPRHRSGTPTRGGPPPWGAVAGGLGLHGQTGFARSPGPPALARRLACAHQRRAAKGRPRIPILVRLNAKSYQPWDTLAACSVAAGLLGRARPEGSR